VEPLKKHLQRHPTIPPLFVKPRSKKMLTDIRSFRLNADLIQKLEEMAARKQIAANVIVSKAVRRAVDYEPKAEQAGIVAIQKTTLKFLWDNLTTENARDLGKSHGGERGAELMLLWFKRFTFEEFVETMRMFGAEWGGVYQFEYGYLDGVHHLVMRHDLGRNFTTYMGAACSETLKLLVLDYEMTESENQLSIAVTR